jgi:hypothetical protein
MAWLLPLGALLIGVAVLLGVGPPGVRAGFVCALAGTILCGVALLLVLVG